MSFKAATRTVKNVVKGYSDLEIKVRQATCNDSYGPSAALMHEITNDSANLRDFHSIVDIIDKRLNDSGKNWRHVFKALTLIQYMLQHGPESFVEYQSKNLHVIKTLKEYQYIDETGHDQGANVRQKCKEVVELLTNDSKLRELRAGRGDARGGDFEYEMGNGGDDDLARAIAASKLQSNDDEARRLARQEEADLQRAIELSEKEALSKRYAEREKLEKTGDLVKPNDDIIDFFGSLQTPAAVAQSSFGGFDPFQQQRMQQEQEMMQQQYYLQQQQQQHQLMMQEQLRQQEIARQQQEFQRQQELYRQQQLQQQQMLQMQQQQQQQQSALFQGNPHNPFAAAQPPTQPIAPQKSELLDLSSNPNAILDPFAAVSKQSNPHGPNNSQLFGGSTAMTSNPFSTTLAQPNGLVSLEGNALGSSTPPMVRNPFSATNTGRFQDSKPQPSLAQLQSNSVSPPPNFGMSANVTGMSANMTGNSGGGGNPFNTQQGLANSSANGMMMNPNGMMINPNQQAMGFGQQGFNGNPFGQQQQKQAQNPQPFF